PPSIRWSTTTSSNPATGSTDASEDIIAGGTDSAIWQHGSNATLRRLRAPNDDWVIVDFELEGTNSGPRRRSAGRDAPAGRGDRADARLITPAKSRAATSRRPPPPPPRPAARAATRSPHRRPPHGAPLRSPPPPTRTRTRPATPPTACAAPRRGRGSRA